MIKFFRRFRKRLVSENRFRKYLVYALGEIILIVIGILIALQISNFNEEQKSVSRYQMYLEDFKLEIVDNQAILQFNKESSYHQMLYSYIALDSLNNDAIPIDERSDYLYWLIQQMGPLRTSTYNTTVMNEIINSGGYSTITSGQIKQSIIDYKTCMEKYYELVDKFQDAFRTSELPYLKEHFSLLDMWNRYDMSVDATELDLADRVGEYRKRDKYFDSDLDAFYNNRKFSTLMNSRHFELRHIYRTLKRQDQIMDDLLREIDREQR